MNTSARPLVSIVIPLYNYAHYIKGCIESACAQTYTHLEILVINDGSKDNSLEVARECTDPRVRILDQTNQGTVGAVNRGITEARGDYIAWLSADDLFAPTKIEQQLAALQACPEAACVYTNLTWRAEALEALEWCPLPREDAVRSIKTAGYVCWDTEYKTTPDAALLQQLLQTQILIYLGTTLIPKAVFTELGLYDPQYRRSHDYEYALRLAAAGKKFVLVDDPLIVCRAHQDNTKYWREIRADENRVRRAYLDKFPIEAFYPRIAEASCTDPERRAILTEHVRWLLHHEMNEEALLAFERFLATTPGVEGSFELAKALMARKLLPQAGSELAKARAWLAAAPYDKQRSKQAMMAAYLQGDANRGQGQLLAALGCYLHGVGHAVRGALK